MIPISNNEEVSSALAEYRPVVALESTIITHGLPFPDNLQIARRIEDEIRNGGATPATIAVLDGRVHVGLETDQLDRLAQAADVAKLSRADLAARIANPGDGATTVAATMICARLAGIEVFATGGIGGVHRGAELSFDISADLEELARTPVTVVAAGVKAILDLPKTLEALETRGVPVIGWRTDVFPAFWSRESGLKAPLRMDDAAMIARAHRARKALGLDGGQLVANPIPEHAEIPKAEIDPIINAALDEAKRMHVTGKEVTPFLLSRILEATQGRSLHANVALVLNNAQLAAEIAKSLAQEAA